MTDKPDAPDARVSHRPDGAAVLIDQAIEIVGTQVEVAARCGVTRDYLRKLRTGQSTMSYALQVTLEQIAGR